MSLGQWSNDICHIDPVLYDIWHLAFGPMTYGSLRVLPVTSRFVEYCDDVGMQAQRRCRHRLRNGIAERALDRLGLAWPGCQQKNSARIENRADTDRYCAHRNARIARKMSF